MTRPDSPPPPLTKEDALEQCYKYIFDSDAAIIGPPEVINALIAEIFETVLPSCDPGLQQRILSLLERIRDSGGVFKLMKELGNTLINCGHADLLDRHYSRVLDAVSTDFISAVNEGGGNGRTVVFLAKVPYFLILREAIYLKRNGYRVFLVSTWPVSEELERTFAENFDAVCSAFGSFRITRSMVRSLTPDVFHVECWMWFYCLPRMVIENKGQAAVVCEFYDVISLYGTRDDYCKIKKPAVVDLEFHLERFILRHADAVLHRFPPDAVEVWKETQGAMPREIEFQSYPCPEFIHYSSEKKSHQDGVKRFVFAGAIPPEKKTHMLGLFGDFGLLGMFRKLVDQGFAVDAMPPPHYRVEEEDEGYAGIFQLTRDNPRFRILEGEPPDSLARRLSVYDFGLYLYDFGPDLDILRMNDVQIKRACSTKLFAYLEAGLPVVVNAEFERPAQIITENGLGIAVYSSEIGRLSEILVGFDYEESAKNICAFNAKHGMDQQIHRLIALYDDILP